MIVENLAGIGGLGDDLMENSPISQSQPFFQEGEHH
jgi:hypothetical protein